MGRWALLIFGGLISSVGWIEHRIDQAAANTKIDMPDPRAVVLSDAPIEPSWIIRGAPRAQSATLGRTHDGTTSMIIWQVSKGSFVWKYAFDETITIVDGEVYLTDGLDAAPGNSRERRLGPGDVAFFHVGSVATWRVPDHVRKIATVKQAPSAPVAVIGRWLAAVKSLVRPTVPATVL